MSSSDELSLRDRQIALIEKMLMFNKETSTYDLTSGLDGQEVVWKVLVLDAKSTAIVSSILRVNDLLKSGVTVHSLIQQKRSPLPDVPVVYFVQPTQENINAIVQDLIEDKYAEFYINFTSVLNRELLEDLAKQVSMTGKTDRIKQVYDQYAEFVVTEPELFSLEMPSVFQQLNDPESSESVITQLCDTIANGLYDAVMTVNSIPIIRAPKGGSAELVAQKLESKLRDYVINTRSNTESTANSLERFVLVILDRNIDLASMFAHSWIYQSLVFDVFKLARNTITIPTKTKDGQEIEKKMDIDPKDFFWLTNSHLPFPDAVENVEAALASYKAEAEDITRKTGVNELSDLDPNANNDTLNIQDAVNKLPELTSRKAIIDTHMSVLASLLSQLESKGLDAFFEIEQGQDSPKTRQRFLETLKDGKTNNLEDKLRTFIILYLTSSTEIPETFIKQVEEYFKSQDHDIRALNYIYKCKGLMKLSAMSLQNKSLESGEFDARNHASGTSSSVLLSGLSNKLYGLTEGKIQGGVGSLISGIKNFLPEKKTIPITNVVEAIMDPLNSSQKNLETTDNYLYFDPKVIRGSHSKKPKRQSYNKSIVFVVGGGNYLEYQNLQEWAHSQPASTKGVMYGSTAIITPANFLNEMASLK
ncbi:LANO_0G08042g1_1 [Lachancea nothofagi CBS 11611]|uniref:LANO_0G08042g1_1 n=1 Tax=Lachancea nothofagi CBS 11611 TaxID=1266666 RepID=A0A1G4KHN3_9SACH|nr:LANO_0G08042g1_1 [Lachancea nothofagi CBS 11611]